MVISSPLCTGERVPSGRRVLTKRAGRAYLQAASTQPRRVPTIRTGDLMGRRLSSTAEGPTTMATVKFRPLHDRVVVRRVEAETKTAGGIIIPDTAKEKPQQGEIIAVGPGARDEQRQDRAARRQEGRPRAVRQVVGHRGQDRRRRPADHEGDRHHGRRRRAADGRTAGPVTGRPVPRASKLAQPLNSHVHVRAHQETSQWLPRK